MLYIHVPFCKRRCAYCDFAIAVRRTVPADAFVACIERELSLRAPAWTGGPVETVYFGGGTPSLLGDAPLARALDAVRSAVGLAPDAEVTIEANPDDVAPERARAWHALGINRVSLGVQSLRPRVLEWMHRAHGPDDGLRAVATLVEAGIPSISVDVIFGLPSDLGADPVGDARRLLECGPQHLSAYGLTVEAGTALFKWVGRGRVAPVSEDEYAREFLALHDLLTDRGWEHYEVSNYAAPGNHSRHNRGYWSGRPYLGLGPSAHSFADGTRRWNVREWRAYRETIERGDDPLDGSEAIGEDGSRLEELYLGLRTSEGIRADAARGTLVADAVARGWVLEDGGRIRATPEGWLRLDALVTAIGEA